MKQHEATRSYKGYPINALTSLGGVGPYRIAQDDYADLRFPGHKPKTKFGPPPLAVRALSWEASDFGLSLQVFEVGTLLKGKWDSHSVSLYPLMLPLGLAGQWELEGAMSVRLVDKNAHGRIVIVNQSGAAIMLLSLVLWCSPLEAPAPKKKATK